MGQPIDRPFSHLPLRFPVGAKYVVEGYSGEKGNLRVVARYIVLPSGRRINVPADLNRTASSQALALRRNSNRKQSKVKGRSARGRRKFAARGGTA